LVSEGRQPHWVVRPLHRCALDFIENEQPARRSALLNPSTQRDAVVAQEYERSCRARALPARTHLQKADLLSQRAEAPTRRAAGRTIDSAQWSARSRRFAQWSHSEPQAIPGPVHRRAGAEHLQTSCLHPLHPLMQMDSVVRTASTPRSPSRVNIPCLQRLRYRRGRRPLRRDFGSDESFAGRANARSCVILEGMTSTGRLPARVAKLVHEIEGVDDTDNRGR
jgi:hypothetical protein